MSTTARVSGLARGVGLGAGALQRLVEGLAVGEVGQAVGHGVAAHLLQVLAQSARLRAVDVGELRFSSGLVLRAAPARVAAARFSTIARTRVAFGCPASSAGAGQRAGRRPRWTRWADLDGAGHAVQFLGQRVAGVADLVVEAGLAAGSCAARLLARSASVKGSAGLDQAVDLARPARCRGRRR